MNNDSDPLNAESENPLFDRNRSGNSGLGERSGSMLSPTDQSTFDPVDQWIQRWRSPIGTHRRNPLVSEAYRLRWWQYLLITPCVILGFGIAVLVVASIVVAIATGESIDPRDSDVFYINDTEQTVVVWECPMNCDQLTNSYHIKPGKKKIYSAYLTNHPVPVALLVKDDSGNALGCVQSGGRSNNYYFRISTLADCDIMFPTPQFVSNRNRIPVIF